MQRWRLALACLPLGAVVGCVPFPNVHYFAPAVSGVVMADGAPVSGARVSVGALFSSEHQVAVTDSQGHFSTAPIRKLELTAMLIGDPLYGFSIDFIKGERIYGGYSENSIGYAPNSIELVCDLERPLVRGARTSFCTAASRS